MDDKCGLRFPFFPPQLAGLTYAAKDFGLSLYKAIREYDCFLLIDYIQRRPSCNFG